MKRTPARQRLHPACFGWMAVAVTGLFCHCGPTPEPRPAPTESRPAPPEPNTLGRSASGVTVLHVGAAPRRKLRYRRDPSWKRDLTQRMTIVRRLHIGAKQVDDFQFRTAVKRSLVSLPKKSGGNLRYSYRVTDAKLVQFTGAGAIAKKIKARLQQDASKATSESFVLVITPRGKLSVENATGSNVPRGSRAELAQQLQQVVVMFPEEPLGLGARWRGRYQSELAVGAEMTSQVTYRLDGLSKDSLEVSFRLQQIAKPRDLAPSGRLPRRLLSRLLTGTGKSSFSLGAPLSTVSIERKIVTRVRMGSPASSAVLKIRDVETEQWQPAP